MAISGAFYSVAAFMAAWKKKLQPNRKSLSKLHLARVKAAVAPSLSRGASFVPFLGAKMRVSNAKEDEKREIRVYEQEEEDDDADELDDGDDDGVWRRTILMGEKCQPLDFSGVIYYDNKGRQLTEVPAPRSPAHSLLHPFADHSAGKDSSTC